jgi:4-hydroxybenzoate polyprenyltransferase
VATDVSRPAFYALASGGWRDYVTLLHPPYTAWHLSFVAIGAALTPAFSLSRVLPTLAAFFLAVGVGAHALDELQGRPLKTQIPDAVLVALGAASIVLAVGIGVVGAVVVDPWIGAFVAAGSFIVVAYCLELFGGHFHSDFWFALSWGSFPVLTGFFAASGTISLAALFGALFAFALSFAQRQLSTRVRDVRRRIALVTGTVTRHDGSVEPITASDLTKADEVALRALTGATIALATALVAMRLA